MSLIGSAHRLPRGAARGGAPGLAGRGPRRDRRAERAAVGRPDDGPGRVRRDAGQAAVAAADLRQPLRPLLPAPGGGGRGRRGRGRRASATARAAVRDNAAALSAFRTELADGAARPTTGRRCSGSRSRWSAGSGRCPAAARGCRRGRRTPPSSGSRPASSPTGSCSRCWPRAGSRRRPTRVAGRRVGGFTRLVEDDARRRIAEEKGADHVADVARAARASTGSTSPPPGRRTSRRCAARSTRWPAGSPPG